MESDKPRVGGGFVHGSGPRLWGWVLAKPIRKPLFIRGVSRFPLFSGGVVRTSDAAGAEFSLGTRGPIWYDRGSVWGEFSFRPFLRSWQHIRTGGRGHASHTAAVGASRHHNSRPYPGRSHVFSLCRGNDGPCRGRPSLPRCPMLAPSCRTGSVTPVAAAIALVARVIGPEY